MSKKTESDFKTNRNNSVAIIGAGLAGLSCANELLSKGVRVHLFEKRDSVAGRMARIELKHPENAEPLWFDHGAQYFTARSREFSLQVDQWIKRKIVQQWDGPFVCLDAGACGPAPGDDLRYVGIPGMDALCIDLAQHFFQQKNQNAKLTFNADVLPLKRAGEKWEIQHKNPCTGIVSKEKTLFDIVVLALPSADVQSMLPAGSRLIEQTASFKMGPCLAVLLAFAESLSLPFGGAFVQNSPLRWISNNSSMPRRDRTPERWILHPSSEWSAEHWNDSDETILKQVYDSFEKATAKTIPVPQIQTLYRWKNALPLQPASQSYFSDPEQRVIIAGDWCTDARVEGAYLSGLKAARYLMQELLDAVP